MEIFDIIILCLVICLFVIILRKFNPEFSMIITIVTGIIIFFMLYDKLAYVIEKINQMTLKLSIEEEFIKTLIKMTGIALICDYSANICKDAGESAFAAKIEFAGKIIILFLSIPIIMGLVNFIFKII